MIIKEYNHHMGGVDLMDGLIGRYHIRMKARKWTNRIFFHLLDMAMVKAHVLYYRLQIDVTPCQQCVRMDWLHPVAEVVHYHFRHRLHQQEQ
ncbi:hypothetical protein ACLKA7_000932 [Drosophila subpalustris]